VPTPSTPVPIPSVVPTAVPTAVPESVSGLTQSLIDRINQFACPAQGATPAPECKKQANFNAGGESTRYPHYKAK